MTASAPRLWRSALFMPASNARALEKSRGLDADILVFDLEDATAEADKESARTMAADRIASREGRAAHVIRVNALDSDWIAADVKAAADANADAIVIPKVAAAADLEAVRRMLPAGAQTPLWAMIETPRALMNLKEIAQAADTGLEALVFGGNDMTSELRARPGADRAELVPHLAATVAAARACGLIALDGVFNDVKDAEGCEAEALQGRRLGFDGKTLIHPAQIDLANRAFSPASDEVDWAEAVAAAFDAPENQGKAVLSVNGEMVEILHLTRARRILAMAAQHENRNAGQ
ncbi:MAG: CoA ester lyase [Euryhalocaulis sp.]|uniref:HpcH/HpaI aldolase/citrate lyase family protein n=1 Tax=Euryhalocaulis sp. TaxID=2744307 RepID=UPI00179F1B02|nr:CoA ester lyase [Euryhalocaulis sp.]MBA4801114.1 CoA ester lyase [Euryhalocaulis sp.]